MPRRYTHTTRFYINHRKYDDLFRLARQSGRPLRRFQTEVKQYFSSYDAFTDWLGAHREWEKINYRFEHNQRVSQEEFDAALERIHATEIPRQRTLRPNSTDTSGRGRHGAGYIRLTWNLPVLEGLDEVTQAVRDNAYLRMRYAASEIRQYMYDNAPWENHTWRAREGLRARVDRRRNGITIRLSYSVYYGQYLEFSNEGRFAIITPTLNNFTDRVLRQVAEGLLRRYGRNA